MAKPPTTARSNFNQLGFRLWRWLRTAFFSGVAVVLPFAVTLWLIWTLIGFIDGTVLGLLPDDIEAYLRQLPGAGLIAAVVFIVAFGALTANFFGRMLVAETEVLLNRVPLVRTIYGGAKQLFQQVANRDRTSFKEAVLVEFPGSGLWSIGFVTSDDGEAIIPGQGEVVAVYIPLAPIPTTGYLIYVPRASLKPYPLGAEDALKRVLSLGAMQAGPSAGLATTTIAVAPNPLPPASSKPL
jgi:uncharacterized membrane protein